MKKSDYFLMPIKRECLISLHTKQQQKMYDGKTNAGVRQDKQPPRRLTAGSPEPQTADPPLFSAMNTKNG
jgi:hypothetical protein